MIVSFEQQDRRPETRFEVTNLLVGTVR